MVFADFFFHALKNAANAKRRYTSIPNQYIRMLGFQSLIVGFERSKLINKLDDTTEVIFMNSQIIFAVIHVSQKNSCQILNFFRWGCGGNRYLPYM